MTTATIDRSAQELLESLRTTREAMTADRVFGAPVQVGATTIIPVAKVTGGAGGGGGEGTEDGETGGGFGTGFGLGVQPIGVYEVHGDRVDWKPSVDVNRVIRGGQVLAGIVVVCVTLVALRRPRTTT